MKKSIVILVAMFLTCGVLAQTAQIDSTSNKLEKLANGRYSISLHNISPKLATSLLTDQIPSRKNSSVTLGSVTIKVEYDKEAKSYSVDGDDNSWKKISDVRKTVKILLREQLGIE